MSNTDHPEADGFLLERARCIFGSWRRLIEAMGGYKKWVRTNREFVHSIESLASGFTWFLPERFSASEIGPEAVATFVGILTTINQHIIDSTPTQMRAGHSEPCLNWSLCISVLKDLENLVEVVAEHYYGDEKWNFIAFMEAIKAVVRLALLRDSGFKMLLQGGEVLNIEKGLNTFDLRIGTPGMANHVYGPGASQRFYGADPRSPALLAFERFGVNAKMASHAAWSSQHQEAVIEKPSITTFFSEKGIFGRLFLSAEALFILRPLVYTLFIRRYGLKSWKPWLVSLGIDLSGMAILSYVTNQRKKGCLQLSSSEEDEIRRRKVVWALYLMRDPFFSKYTRLQLERAERSLDPVPFLGLLTAKVAELIIGAQTRYTYTSAS